MIAPGDAIVKPHVYSVRLQHQGKGKPPALRGLIYERDVQIGRFSRGAVRDHFCPPIVSTFFSERARMRFESFADCLSVEETVEALLPREAFP